MVIISSCRTLPGVTGGQTVLEGREMFTDLMMTLLLHPSQDQDQDCQLKICKNYISHFYIALVISHVQVNQTILAWSFLNRHDNGQNIYQPASSGQLCYAMIWWVRGVQDGEIISKCGVVGLFKFWTWPDSNYDWYFCLTMMDCPDTKSPLTCTQL